MKVNTIHFRESLAIVAISAVLTGCMSGSTAKTFDALSKKEDLVVPEYKCNTDECRMLRNTITAELTNQFVRFLEAKNHARNGAKPHDMDHRKVLVEVSFTVESKNINGKKQYCLNKIKYVRSYIDGRPRSRSYKYRRRVCNDGRTTYKETRHADRSYFYDGIRTNIADHIVDDFIEKTAGALNKSAEFSFHRRLYGKDKGIKGDPNNRNPYDHNQHCADAANALVAENPAITLVNESTSKQRNPYDDCW